MTHRLLAVLLLFSTVLAPGLSQDARAATPDGSVSNIVQSLDYAFFAGGKLAIKIVFKHDLRERPNIFTTYYPAVRIVMDFSNMRSTVSTEPIKVRQRDLWSLQVVHSGLRSRIIIDLLRPMIRNMETTGNELMITLHPPASGDAPLKTP